MRGIPWLSLQVVREGKNNAEEAESALHEERSGQAEFAE